MTERARIATTWHFVNHEWMPVFTEHMSCVACGQCRYGCGSDWVSVDCLVHAPQPDAKGDSTGGHDE